MISFNQETDCYRPTNNIKKTREVDIIKTLEVKINLINLKQNKSNQQNSFKIIIISTTNKNKNKFLCSFIKLIFPLKKKL